jgi:hypothetical protein
MPIKHGQAVEVLVENPMSHFTDGAEVLALWSNRGLTHRHGEKSCSQPLKRAAKGKRTATKQQLTSDRRKLRGKKGEPHVRSR